MSQSSDVCPNCGSPLKEPEETKTGKKLQRCSRGVWNPQTHQTEGCDYVKWLTAEPKMLDEACPKCGAPLVMQITRTGKKMKKCSTGGWDKENRVATGCDYVQWMNGSTTPLEEDCPLCGEKLVLFVTNAGKRMKKCSTAGWDTKFRQPTGCTYVQWLKE